jgi:heat shock 70kDa protein 4
VTPEEKEGLIGKLREVEDWLYEDGEDETKGVYISKLEDLNKVFLYALNYSIAWSTPAETSCMLVNLDDTSFLQLQIGDPIEARYKESTERGSSVDQLVYCINSFREAALSSDQKFGHIDISEKQKVGQSAI